MKKVQHLISTMGQDNLDFLRPMNCTADILIVNQKKKSNEYEEYTADGRHIKVICTEETGLSNSRNMLLDHASGSICILGDDDLVYRQEYEKEIINAYERYPQADIIAFRFSESADEDTRMQFPEPRSISLFSISKVASVEITFRLDSIRKMGIKFDPLLGLGGAFGSCEENAFLADALRHGLKIQYVPITICHSIPCEERKKWSGGYDRYYFECKGASFYRVYGNAYVFFSIAFLLLKKATIFKNVPIVKGIRWLLSGKKRYRAAQKEQLAC